MENPYESPGDDGCEGARKASKRRGVKAAHLAASGFVGGVGYSLLESGSFGGLDARTPMMFEVYFRLAIFMGGAVIGLTAYLTVMTARFRWGEAEAPE